MIFKSYESVSVHLGVKIYVKVIFSNKILSWFWNKHEFIAEVILFLCA
ncbi:hypothetical protein PIL02S_03321 [Paenibacillus illinoisensis]|uniref:Uncharacterized protein n=1 Tax=Paenibacillus illinoisensis TaxID=59845 RepID=A0A2W0CIM8_9BACL|nr:hypothetical protein PIL02S_03321 [Paenibacillus illinoisensis]